MNRVDYLLARPFAIHTLAEKKVIKRLGPHQPADIVIRQHRPNASKKHQNRKFVVSWFGKKKWLTVSESNKGLYCFPCLLFGGDTIWCRSGYYDLKHLSERMRRHECSSVHVNNCVQLKLFGQVDMGDTAMNVNADQHASKNAAVTAAAALKLQQQHYEEELEKHNAEVDNNHHLLTRLTDCVLFYCSSGLPLRALDAEGSTNESLAALMNFMSTMDPKLALGMDSSSCIQFDSVRNELLACMLQVYREQLAKEMSVARFVAIQVDDVMDVSGLALATVVFRYLASEDKIAERLWGFVDITDIARVAEILLTELAKYNLDKKLIAQSYDGALLVKGTSVPHKIRMLYPFANFVQCYAHPLTLVVQRASSVIPLARVFFANLGGFTEFFSDFEKRVTLLMDICKSLGTYWNLEVHPVIAVSENHLALLDCLNRIVDGEDWDSVSVREACMLRHLLHDAVFLFFLKLFNLIMPFADILYQKLLTTDISEISAKRAIENFMTALLWISENEVDSLALNVVETDGTSSKMEVNDGMRQAAKEVCDVIIWQIKERFDDLDTFLAFQLVDSNLFEKHKAEFPEEQLSAAANAYPNISKDKLKAELQVLYKVPYFTFPKGISSMLDSIKKNDLKDDFSETWTLLELAVTTPIVTMETERCLQTLQRTKCFLKSTRDKLGLLNYDNQNALAVLTVHADFVKSVSNFNDLVIEKFADRDNHNADFTYTVSPQDSAVGWWK